MWAAARDPWTQQNTLQSDLGMIGFSETGDLWGGWGGPSVDLMDAFGVDPLDDPRDRKDYDSRRKATIMMAGDTYEYFWTDKGGFDLLRFIYDSDNYGVGGPGGVFQGPCGAQNVKHLYGNTHDHETATGLTPPETRRAHLSMSTRYASVHTARISRARASSAASPGRISGKSAGLNLQAKVTDGMISYASLTMI